jgi:CDP-diacylglycerol--glycerol-3-phosphate 3-phosphatidyltransferase
VSGEPGGGTSGAAVPPATASAWNLPNALTLLRLILVPVFGWLLLRESGEDAASRVAAFVVFVLASVTDFLDGKIARDRGIVTTFGTIADPIADKALTGTALVGLSLLGELPWWITVVVLVREIGITVLRFVVIRHGVMPAGRGGKTKTALQLSAIGLYLLPLPASWAWLEQSVMGLAVVVTVLTGLDYLLDARRLRRDSARTAMKRARRAAAGG